jgi:hypothetical protein
MPQLDVDAIVQTSKQYVIAVRITHPGILEEGHLDTPGDVGIIALAPGVNPTACEQTPAAAVTREHSNVAVASSLMSDNLGLRVVDRCTAMTF